MFHDLRSPLILAGAGFCCGIGLSFIGFLAAGFGHGSYVLMGLFSSPLGLFNSIQIAFAAPPLIWAFVGFLIGHSRTSWLCRLTFPVFMLIHYVSLFAILRHPSEFADWSYVEKVKDVVVFGGVIYLIGQFVLWFLFASQFLNRQKDREL